MKHQLIPNTYTICESTEQCKELFEWAKANGVKTYMDSNAGETVLSFGGAECTPKELVADLPHTPKYFEEDGVIFMPLPEFISRLKGEWVEGISITLPKDVWEEIWQDALLDNGYTELADKIKEQLNQHQ